MVTTNDSFVVDFNCIPRLCSSRQWSRTVTLACQNVKHRLHTESMIVFALKILVFIQIKGA